MSALPQLRDANPFDLADDATYRRWRDRKLARHPARIEDLIVEVIDPRRPSDAEHAALLDRVRRANMALYASSSGADPDKDIPRLLARRFGLEHLDCNLLADDDGITPLAVAESGGRTQFIPYTNRPIRWHTDGYYNTPEHQIRAMVLHCVTPAAEGGGNRLLDHEIAYIWLRDRDPELIRALMQPDAMTIPARTDEDGVARPDQGGPVFSVDPATGALHMRYTARTQSIAWKQDAATLAAVEALKSLLASDSPLIFEGRLESGMGLLCNNVLHDRSGFADAPGQQRLLYRARYYDRIAGT
jgi:TfdA family taurine catabolism dioxygenase TauD